MPPVAPGELATRRELAFMTECLRRAVEWCRPTLSADHVRLFERVASLAWDWVEGATVDGDERAQLHREVERLGKRNSPQRSGRLELYHLANAATFVLGVIVNVENVRYAGTLRHTVPCVLRVLFPHDYEHREQAERRWQLAAAERVTTIETPSRDCFPGIEPA